MKTTMTKNPINLAVACALAMSFAASAVQAQALAPAAERQTWTSSGNQVWKNSYGECWHSSFGPASAGECNPQPVAQAAPRAVAAAPAPAPYVAPIVVAAADPKPVYERVTFDANVLFDFDKSTLSQAGRNSLDAFISKTRDLIDPSAMVAVGYADRIGASGYNQTLSESRVATVKSYLVSQGVTAAKVTTSARGETQPTTKGECDGKANAKNIACLQPDRHVFIELTGSRLKK